MYKCDHFDIEELVSRKAFRAKGEQCWRFLNPFMLRGIDAFRKRYGPTHMNTWKWGGVHQYRGLRLPGELEDLSSPFSAHRRGCAADLEFEDVTPEEVRADILDGRFHVEQLTELELATPTWVHVAFGTNVLPILTFDP